MEDETFAGEGIFDPIRPDEKRLVSYATDLALNVSSRNNTERERVSRVRINRGTMIQESEVREKKTYTFRNEDTAPRTVDRRASRSRGVSTLQRRSTSRNHRGVETIPSAGGIETELSRWWLRKRARSQTRSR